MLSFTWRDRTPPLICPNLKSSLASSDARGKTESLILEMRLRSPSSWTSAAVPMSRATRKALPLRPSMILATRVYLSLEISTSGSLKNLLSVVELPGLGGVRGGASVVGISSSSTVSLLGVSTLFSAAALLSAASWASRSSTLRSVLNSQS